MLLETLIDEIKLKMISWQNSLPPHQRPFQNKVSNPGDTPEMNYVDKPIIRSQ